MTASRIRAVVFDVGGVLAANLHWYEGWSEGLIADERRAAVEERRLSCWKRMREDPSLSEQAFWQAVLEEAGLASSIQVDLCQQAIRRSWRPYFSTLAIADRLRSRGYEIAICSNHAQQWFEEIVARFCFSSVFQKPELIVASYAVACSKPSFSIFNVVMSRLTTQLPDLQRSEVVLVDDQLKNTTAAQSFGWNSILYDAAVQDPIVLVEALQSLGVNSTEMQ